MKFSILAQMFISEIFAQVSHYLRIHNVIVITSQYSGLSPFALISHGGYDPDIEWTPLFFSKFIGVKSF
jgi:hypothetical protein